MKHLPSKGMEMKINKQNGIRIFFIGEVIIFLGFYLFGSNGYILYKQLSCDVLELSENLSDLKTEILQLQSNIELQKKHPFFQEKIAREQLQMARAEEEIYLIE